MKRTLGALAVGAILAVGPTASSGVYVANPGTGRFSVTNDTERVVECNVLIDGRTRTYIKVHPAKTYFTDVDAGRLVQLVCMRGKVGVYGPLKLGADYRFVPAPSLRVDLRDAKAD